MCRSLITAVALALGLAACEGYEPPAGGSTSAPINQHPVVAGESNRFFTAASAQSVALAPGVLSAAVKDSHDRYALLMTASDGSAATVSCECPASCTAAVHRPLSFGCWELVDTGERSHCWEACGGPGEACRSCRLVFSDGDTAGTELAEATNEKEGDR